MGGFGAPDPAAPKFLGDSFVRRRAASASRLLSASLEASPHGHVSAFERLFDLRFAVGAGTSALPHGQVLREDGAPPRDDAWLPVSE